MEANTAELEHAEPTPPVFGDDAKAIYRDLAGPLASNASDIPQPESSSTASAQVGAEAPTPAETVQPSAEVVDLPKQAEETGLLHDPVPDPTISPATAEEETVVDQPAPGVKPVTLATDPAQAAAAAPDTVLDSASEPAPPTSEQADAAAAAPESVQDAASKPAPPAGEQADVVALAASVPSEETTTAEADTVAARDAPSAVALPAEDTLLDDSTAPAPAAELDAKPEGGETASAAVDEEAAKDDDEVLERPPVESESSNLHAEEQEAAEPAAAVDTAGVGEDAATGAASGEAAGAETAATAEAAAPAAPSEVTAAAADEPTSSWLGEDAGAKTAAADDKDDAVDAAPVVTLATGHPSAGTFTDSHGSQAEDEFHDAHDEHSKAVSPAGGSPAASE